MKATIQFIGTALVAFMIGQPAFAHRNEPSPSVPATIAVPAGYEVEVKFHASGVQIYRCRPSARIAARFDWTFVAPDATLFDGDGKAVGRHYAGPTWEASDGSKVVGKEVARVAAPNGSSLPWLLLTATVVQTGETFKRIGFLQRLHTNGGSAPTPVCTADTADVEVRVPYTADYYFYSLR
ncbi:MAG: DUF3455 domain-containing protein [Betaproteobacteria bacterium]|nr:DUF3455 domain-containing protein [Betaproteobacteria bacterium]